LTAKQERALAALVTQPTQAAAAAAAGVDSRTLRRYLADPDFQAAYKAAFSDLVSDAVRQSQQALAPALATLREIAEDAEQPATVRVQASRSLLEFGLRFTETYDVLAQLQDLERRLDG
jgi:hypothetical protein